MIQKQEDSQHAVLLPSGARALDPRARPAPCHYGDRLGGYLVQTWE